MTQIGGPAPVPRIGNFAVSAIFLLALAARLAAVTWAGWSTVAFGDGPAYLFAARELVRTGHYPIATEAFYFRAPGYPVFLAAVTLGRPDRIAAAKAANVSLGALAVLVLAALSARVFRRRGLAIATGLAAAVHPGLVSLSRDIASEPLFLLLLLAAGFLLLAATDRPSSNLALAAGIATALAALTRPSALVLIPFLAAPLFDRHHPMRARLHIAASALLGFALALAPWTIRNAAVFHEFVPVNDAAASAFYQGNSDWMVRFYRLRSHAEYLAWSRAMFSDLEGQTAQLAREGRSSVSARARYFVAKTFAERAQDPAGWARLLLRKAWDFVRPYPNPLFWPLPLVASVGAVELVVTVLAAVGLAGGHGRRGVRAFSLLFLAVTLAAHVVFIVVWRYRIPYWDPVLLLYSAPGGARLLGR
ncbi:MAG: glycosyltransferase family 39 protein [Acidobacteriota bacterium]|nr:glycosyltransferase family 39 protein [Acidobacteriota bacterium]